MLGRQLATLHRHTEKRHGWHRDNTIGPTPQHNPWTDDWITFFRDHRLRFQLDLAARNGYAGELQTLGLGLADQLEELFRDYRPEGYLVDEPLVPHGISVILNAPAVFRFTGEACPERHLRAAELLGADVCGAKEADAGKILADRVLEFMQRLKIPNGLSAVGYTRDDVPVLVQGTLPQHRVTKLSPRPAGEEELTRLFEDSMVAW
jgi:hydroxyacid-oxoacid transhydrogenase